MAKISRREQALNTEHKIIQATMELLKTHSLQELQIKQICRQAQTSIGNFYHHFPNKHSILIKILDNHYALLLKKLDHLPQKASVNNVLKIFEIFCEVTQQLGAELTLELFVYNIISKDNFLLDPKRPLFQYLLQEINKLENSGGFKSKESSVEITQNILIVSRGFLYEWCLTKGSFPLSQTIQEQVRLYLTLYQ